MECNNVYTEGNISIPCNRFYCDPNEFCDPCKTQFQTTDMKYERSQYMSWYTCSGRLFFLHELQTLYTYMDCYYDCSQYYEPIRDRAKKRKDNMLKELTKRCKERTKAKKNYTRYHTSISKSVLGKRGKMYKRFKHVPSDLLGDILSYSY